MPDLSVIIPARNEAFLRLTVEDVLRNSTRDTEIIVVLDGAWPSAPLEQHPRVQMLYVPEAIGQRAATNIGARISTARYVMKADAHVAFAKGFDAALIDAAKEIGDHVTQIPALKHLHVYNLVCEQCGNVTDQAPDIKECGKCQGRSLRKDIVWEPRKNRPTTTAWRVDSELKFQYWGEYTHRPEAKADIHDVMTSLGACFFVGRERYWELGGFDEQVGSWGQFGQEWAFKNWLSGGRHVVNRRTWHAHFFRVGGIGFPYPISGEQQEAARVYSRKMWMGNNWPQAVHSLKWLVEKFAPVPGWSQEQIDALPSDRITSGVVTSASLSLLEQDGQPLGSEAALVLESGASGELLSGSINLAPVSGHAAQSHQLETLAASPESVLVCAGESVASEAVGFSRIGSVCTSENVLTLRNSSEMLRIAASGPVTDEMVQNHLVSRQVLYEQGVHEAVDKYGADRYVPALERSVSAGVAGTSPNPASTFMEYDLAKDTCCGAAGDLSDRETLADSHASALLADVGSGPSVRHQRIGGPSILHQVVDRGVVYYSDCRPDPDILEASRRSIERSGLPIVAVTLQPIEWPAALNVVWPGERCALSMFRQILIGLELLKADIVFFAEQDVVYAPDHYQFTPPSPDVYWFNVNVFKVDAVTGRAVTYLTKQTSGLCANRQLLIEHYRKRVERVERDGFSRRMGFEPGGHRRAERIDDVPSDVWRSAVPNIDIRHSANLTASRWSPDEFRDKRNCQGWTESDSVPGWGVTRGRFAEFLQEVAHGQPTTA